MFKEEAMTDSQAVYLAMFMMDNKISDKEAEYIKLIHDTTDNKFPETIKLPNGREITIDWSSIFK